MQKEPEILEMFNHITSFEFAVRSAAELWEFLSVRHHNRAKHLKMQEITKEY